VGKPEIEAGKRVEVRALNSENKTVEYSRPPVQVIFKS
jgi:hypothetical protein